MKDEKLIMITRDHRWIPLIKPASLLSEHDAISLVSKAGNPDWIKAPKKRQTVQAKVYTPNWTAPNVLAKKTAVANPAIKFTILIVTKISAVRAVLDANTLLFFFVSIDCLYNFLTSNFIGEVFSLSIRRAFRSYLLKPVLCVTHLKFPKILSCTNVCTPIPELQAR